MRWRQMTSIPDRPTFGVKKAAEFLGVSPSTVYEALYRKEIPGVKIGSRWIIPRQALSAFMGIADEATEANKKAKRSAMPRQPEEWTYLVTIRRVRPDEPLGGYSVSPAQK